jgi:hypothetical protein
MEVIYEIFINLPEKFEIIINDKAYDIKADIEFDNYQNQILTLKTDIKAPLLVKNIFINNIRDFILKCGFKSIVSFNKISID